MSTHAMMSDAPLAAPLSPVEALRGGFTAFQAGIGPAIGMGLFALGIQLLCGIPWLGFLVAILVAPAATAGIYRYSTLAVRGARPDFEEVLSGFRRWWPATATVGLAAALPLLAAAPILGVAGAMGAMEIMSLGLNSSDTSRMTLSLMPALIACIVLFLPVALWLAYRVLFAPFVVMDEPGVGAVEAVKRSWAMTRGSWWRVFGLQWLLALVAVAGLLVLCVGILAAIPIVYFSLAHAHEQLRARAAGQAAPIA